VSRPAPRWRRSRACALVAAALLLAAAPSPAGAQAAASAQAAPQWRQVELAFESARDVAGAYTAVEAWVEFVHSGGATIRRPAFWDGGRTWRVRFTSPVPEGTWRWTAKTTPSVEGIDGAGGTLAAGAGAPGREGLLRMSPGGRNAVRADGTGFFVVADTAWALPFRATVEQARVYAADRQQKGFNAALLMTVQPDMRAEGPEDRTAYGGFGRGFHDLPEGRLTKLNPAYFQHLDALVEVLLAHGIVPIYQPVFHGFGWKGQGVAGLTVSPEDYARYCRYLVARYGARPAMWLPGADGTGREPNVRPAGEEIARWDAYQQPSGIHYNPWQNSDAHWDAPFFHFHLCQTGHGGDHRPERVAVMHARAPVRAVANGEPTYEGMGGGRHGRGWWQGHEAWLNVTAGGTFGVFYGAASLWQWRLDDKEPGWGEWSSGPWGWRQALDLEGSRYPGLVGRALAGLDFVDMTVRLDVARAARAVAKDGSFALVYLPQGGGVHVMPWADEVAWRLMDAQTGEWLQHGVMDKTKADAWMGPRLEFPAGRPLVLVVGTPRQ
jgi:hypothetical protein